MAANKYVTAAGCSAPHSAHRCWVSGFATPGTSLGATKGLNCGRGSSVRIPTRGGTSVHVVGSVERLAWLKVVVRQILERTLDGIDFPAQLLERGRRFVGELV